MRSLLPSQQKRARKLNSLSEVFQGSHYSDNAFNPPPQHLLTKYSNSSSQPKFRQRCLKTETSQLSRKWMYKKVNATSGEDKVKLLTNLRSICKQYDEQNQISQRMCKRIYQVLDMLVKQESTYGRDMEQFFCILKKLMFCDNDTLKQNLQEFGEGGTQPYNCLIMNVIDYKYAQVIAKSKEIDNQIQQMNERIIQIDNRYQQKMKVAALQHANSATALRIEHQAEIFQLNLKISLLKDTVESYERNFRKAGMEVPIVKQNQYNYGVTTKKTLRTKKSVKRDSIGEDEIEINDL